MDGGAGNDTLDGGQGDDVMTGGTGADTFLMPSDVLFLHATVVGSDTVLGFGGGNRLTLDHISDWAMLAAQIDYI